MDELLTVKNLSTVYQVGGRTTKAVEDVSFSVSPGETFGLVGESGCGKSTVCRAILQLLPEGIAKCTGEILFKGQNILSLSPGAMRKVRGKQIGMIFQEPMAAMNPVLKLKTQIYEQFEDSGMSEEEKHAAAVDIFRQVGIPDPEKRLEQYIHEFSGGMCQRAMIATVLAAKPSLLLADEPTTALDVTIQAQILYLMSEMRRSMNMGMILVTHDMGVASLMCDRIAVLYAGRIVELAPSSELFRSPSHPYTSGLLECLPENKQKNVSLAVIEGSPPSLSQEIKGCAFAPRCRYAGPECFESEPPLKEIKDGHLVRCFHRDQVILIQGTPKQDEAAAAEDARPVEREELLSVSDVSKHFMMKHTLADAILRRPKQYVYAVNNVTLNVKKGETLGIVGESGCGKSTLARVIIHLYDANSGSIVLDGNEITKMSKKELRSRSRDIQMIFQDPYTSLNPRMTVRETLREVLTVHKMRPADQIDDRINELMDEVGLRREYLDRVPDQFSGGQQQRIGIARALAMEPKLILADEPVSALDVSIQAQIINLLKELQKKLHLTIVFISHDLSVVRYIADRIAVMYLGRIVEMGDAEKLFKNPVHPYTKALLSATPEVDPDRHGVEKPALEGEPQSPTELPKGCPFEGRCPVRMAECGTKVPETIEIEKGHFVACVLAGGLRVEKEETDEKE